MWKCPRCEVLNEDHLDECEVCFFSKNSTPSAVEDTWICPRCETINNATQDVCEVCFATKPEFESINPDTKRRRRRAEHDEHTSAPVEISHLPQMVSEEVSVPISDIVLFDVAMRNTIDDIKIPLFSEIVREENRAEEIRAERIKAEEIRKEEICKEKIRAEKEAESNKSGFGIIDWFGVALFFGLIILALGFMYTY